MGDALEDGQRFAGSTCAATAEPFFGRALKVASSGRSRSASSCWRSRAISACSAFSAASAAFSSSGERVGFLHPLEHARLVVADLLFGDAHLLLHRLVFLVGLHLHQLVLELAQPSLNAARSFSISRRAAWQAAMRALTASTTLRALGQPRVERRLQRRDVGDPPAVALGGEVEFLEVNQMLKVWMQGVALRFYRRSLPAVARARASATEKACQP